MRFRSSNALSSAKRLISIFIIHFMLSLQRHSMRPLRCVVLWCAIRKANRWLHTSLQLPQSALGIAPTPYSVAYFDRIASISAELFFAFQNNNMGGNSKSRIKLNAWRFFTLIRASHHKHAARIVELFVGVC